MKQWYEQLFENYGKSYDSESFVRGTEGECDFFEQEINFNRNTRILDLGCGTGRHSVELAKRGYNITGADLSEAMLSRARQKAAELNLSIDFQQHDARNLPFREEFDMVIMICEGSFPLMETDEMNFMILQSAQRALRPGGKLIFTTLNGLFPLFHSVKDFLAATARDDNAHYEKNSFDLMTFRDHNTTILTDDSGNKMELAANERYYVPSEITWLLKSLEFRNISIYGAKLGAFSRNNELATGDYEMLIIATKSS